MGKIEKTIIDKLNKKFSPIILHLENESHMHSQPQGLTRPPETHFKLLLVSDFFSSMNRVRRQQSVNAVITEELNGEVHAFSQRVYTAAEWEKIKDDFEMKSPNCAGAVKN